MFERTGVERAAVCGVSFGGFVALRYAATRPERVSALILVSAPAPGWKPSRAAGEYIAQPWLIDARVPRDGADADVARDLLGASDLARNGCVRGRARAARAVGADDPGADGRPREAAAGDRLRCRLRAHHRADAGRHRRGTISIRVVPVPVTRGIRDADSGVANYVLMDENGHLGMLTQPERFARVVSEFAQCQPSLI